DIRGKSLRVLGDGSNFYAILQNFQQRWPKFTQSHRFFSNATLFLRDPIKAQAIRGQPVFNINSLHRKIISTIIEATLIFRRQILHMDHFRALVVDKDESEFTVNLSDLTIDDLPEGDVLIKVAYSSINYKDGLAAIPDGKIVSDYPFVPGIDLAGTVVSSTDSRFKEGDDVIATSYEIGVSHYGGYSEYARIPADWIVPLPEGLTLKEAMTYGTAGFTAALSIHQLEHNGLTPEDGQVLVTGATGGVGSSAVAMLKKRGYDVVASTGKKREHDYLRKLGASEIISREDLQPEKIRPLDKQRWAGAVDPVGGKTLAYILSTTKYRGSVAVTGLTGGPKVPTTVFP